jgi:two-component system sensor histidine kinase and response regulator WspE
MSEGGTFTLLDLFREEVRSHAATLSQGLLALEAEAANPRKIEPLMRAAHSIKGAARIVGIDAAVGLAHVMEDAFVAAGQGRISITPADVDLLLQSTDLLAELKQVTEETVSAWGQHHQVELAELVGKLAAIARGEGVPAAPPAPPSPAPPPAPVELPPVSVPVERPVLVLPEEPIVPGEENPLFDLFREELRTQAIALQSGVLAVEQDPSEGQYDTLIQAARAIKGSALIVGVTEAGALAGALETVFTTLKQGQTAPSAGDVDEMLRALVIVAPLASLPPEGVEEWREEHKSAIAEVKTHLEAIRPRPAVVPVVPILAPVAAVAMRMPVGPVVSAAPVVPELPSPRSQPEAETSEAEEPSPQDAPVVRVTAQSLNRLMSLAGESLVQARWLHPFSQSLQRLKKHQDHLTAQLDHVAQALTEGQPANQVEALLAEMRKQTVLCRQVLGERMSEFEEHAGGAEDLNSRLYREVITSRMRPFADGAHGFPRLVRDMGRRLGRSVRLEIDGLSTEVDRDILEQLESPLNHLLRNAIDHGIEPPEVRRSRGKPEQGRVRLEVLHRAGSLAITVSDDGGGIDPEQLRRKIVARGLSSADMTAGMSEAELLEFLFLPGFSTAREVTEYSGRGVGLDVVQTTIRKIGGSVRITSRPGQGTTFHLKLPLTLSVVRAVLVTIAGEPYAFPHNRIDRLLRVNRDRIRSLEHRHYVVVDGQNVGLVLAAQVLDLEPDPRKGALLLPEELPVLLMSDDTGPYGLIVDAFRGEQDLVVRTLDPRLGKVPNIGAAALLDDGSPVLIADVEDLIRSMDHFIQSGSLRRCDQMDSSSKRKKRVLVVDDSITVREVERQLLRNAGYDVEVAVDGKDGWNQVRDGAFDLVVTDVDMPRMTGLDLVKAIRDHEPLKDVPIIIVSYKDRDEERLRGLHLGANFYLTKSSFHDDTFLQAVMDLIGES